MNFYKKVASNTFYQIIARIFSTGTSFLITLFIARHFGIGEYGDYAKVTAYISLFYLFADFGLNAIFLQKEDSSNRFRDLLYSRILLALGVVIVSNIIALLLPFNPATGIGFSPLVRVGIFVFSATILSEAILYCATAVFQQKLIYKQFMIATAVGSISTLIFVLLFGILNLPLIFVFVAFVAGGFIEAVSAILYTDEALFPLRVQTKFIKQLFYQTFPVTLMLIFNMIYFRVDMILLSLFKPSADVGIYDLSIRVFDFLIALPLFLSNVLYPKIIQDEKNSRNVRQKVLIYLCLFAGLGLITAIPMWFVSPIIFEFIKPTFKSAVIPMHLLLLSLPVFFVTSILQWLLLAKRKQISLALMYGLLLIGNIIFNVIFIPQYSYVASAIITGVSEVAICIGMLLIFFI